MGFKNDIVGKPVKAYSVNDLIGEVNALVARPILHSVFFPGAYRTTTSSRWLNPICISMPIRKAPRVFIEIASIGTTPEDDAKLLVGSSQCARFNLSPNVYLKASNDTGSGTTKTSTSVLFNNYNLSRSIPIEVGASITMCPTPQAAIFTQDPYGFAHKIALWIGFSYVAPPTNMIGDVDQKGSSTTISAYYAPWFIANIIVDYEEQL